MPKKKPPVGWLARIDKGTATTLGIVLASAVTTWAGSCRTNERVDAATSLAVSGAEVDATVAGEIAALKRDVAMLKGRRRVLVVDTLRVTVVQKKRGGLFGPLVNWLTAPPTK